MKVKDLESQHLFCRDLRHSWDEKTVTGRISTEEIEGGKRRVLVRTTACRRCGTLRKERISLTTYRVLSRTYGYADHYLVKGGLDSTDVRRESLRRLLPGKRL